MSEGTVQPPKAAVVVEAQQVGTDQIELSRSSSLTRFRYLPCPPEDVREASDEASPQWHGRVREPVQGEH